MTSVYLGQKRRVRNWRTLWSHRNNIALPNIRFSWSEMNEVRVSSMENSCCVIRDRVSVFLFGFLCPKFPTLKRPVLFRALIRVIGPSTTQTSKFLIYFLSVIVPFIIPASITICHNLSNFWRNPHQNLDLRDISSFIKSRVFMVSNRFNCTSLSTLNHI